MRLFISIILLPFIFFYGRSFVNLVTTASLSDPLQLAFFVAFGISTVVFFLIIKGNAYLAVFEHELTHNLFAILTFTKPVGFHVFSDKSGGTFEYDGRGNIFMTLAPYFFQTFTFLMLPLYLVFNKDHYLIFNMVFGVLTGFHTSTTIKEFSFRQPDIKRNGLLLSTLLVIFLSVITYGIILNFVIGNWIGIKEFLISGITELIHQIRILINSRNI